jgi:ABC-2 type transport system permease protein
MKALLIAGVNLRRTLRDPTGVFFIFVFPLVMILIIGVSFGGSDEPRVGLVNRGTGSLAAELADQLRSAQGLDVQLVDDSAGLVRSVERGELAAGVELPADYDDAVRGEQTVPLRYVVRPDLQSQQVGSIVSAVVAEQSARFRVARFVAAETQATFDQAMRAGAAVESDIPRIEAVSTTVGTSMFPEELGRFDLGASGQMVLFIFITSMIAAAALIETRRLGMSRRMLSTPTSDRAIVAGEAIGRFTVAVVQGGFIMMGTALIFGVFWGDPVAALALMLSFALVASGAGMLLGAAARSSQQAIAIGILLGNALAAVGGAMLPLEFFSPTMHTIAHFTPHAWAIEGFNELVLRGGGVTQVAAHIGVLLGTAAVLFALASWQLRRAITR